MIERCGVLLLNIGTPAWYNYGSVRVYLSQFLMDDRIIDMPYVLRFLLVNFFIAPLRARESAKRYREIWREDGGSPLQAISERQVAMLGHELGERFIVRLAMRYGHPRLLEQVKDLMAHGCQDIVLAPLFPQYSSSATGSALEEALSAIAKLRHLPSIKTMKPFFGEDFFIKAYARLIAAHLSDDQHLVLSFHGLPYDHLKKSHHDGDPCPKSASCPALDPPPFCYRAQCFATARLIAKALDLKPDRYTVCFQSRLGWRPWTEPYLIDTLRALRGRSISRIAVCCPSFVGDCLETEHEIGVEARAAWAKMGGEEMVLVPCLNTDKQWLSGLARRIEVIAMADGS